MQGKKEEDLQQALNKVSEVGIDEVELTDELNNTRKKRRRSSASIE